jgi:hypothetical protein
MGPIIRENWFLEIYYRCQDKSQTYWTVFSIVLIARDQLMQIDYAKRKGANVLVGMCLFMTREQYVRGEPQSDQSEQILVKYTVCG